jgi:zinc protease
VIAGLVLSLGARAAAPPTTPPTEPAATAAPVEPVGPDRSKPPEVKDPPVLPLPEPEVHEVAPGITAKLVRVPGVRSVSVSLQLGRGAVELDGRNTALTQGTGWLADAAAGDLTAAQLQELEDLKEIDVSTWYGQHQCGVELTVPVEELAAGLELFGKVVRSPTFPKADVARWKLDQQLFYTVEGPASQDALARAAMSFAWFAPDHPYGVRPDLRAFRDVATDALSERWARGLKESPLSVVAVGDVEWSALEPALKAALTGLGTPGDRSVGLEATAPKGRVIVVDLPGQPQVAVRARWEAPAFRAPDYPAVTVANYFLGGAFLSRLNLNLREEKGFTYGARSMYTANEKYGSLTVSVDVKAVNLAATITEIEKELHRVGAEPGTDEELTSARRGFAADWNRTLQTADTAAAAYGAAHDWGLTMAEWRTLTEGLQAVTLPQVQEASGRWFGDERPVTWVLVGDAAAIREQLGTLGRTAEVVSAADAIVGAF